MLAGAEAKSEEYVGAGFVGPELQPRDLVWTVPQSVRCCPRVLSRDSGKIKADF